LDYTTDYGATWTNIVGSLPAEYPSGFAWVVPNTPSTFCKVRVTDINDPTMVDESDNVFTINSGNGFDSISYGGKIYHIVKIGTQTWLKENLDIGTMISGTLEQTDNQAIEKYCYNDDPVNCDTYGGLYQWDEAMQYNSVTGMQGICPIGWHIPDDSEWKVLEMYLGLTQAEVDATGWRGTDQGNKLKSISGWSNQNGTDESEFTALPAGYRYYYNQTFLGLGDKSDFLTSTGYDEAENWTRRLSSDYTNIYRYHFNKQTGKSVRCLKDEFMTATIELTSPNGGENFFAGTIDTLRWKSSYATTLNIDYSIDNGTTWTNIYSAMPAGIGSTPWLIPNTPSTSCKVRIADAANPTIFDESDRVFTISDSMSNGLVAYYPFNGNANDESGNGNNGTNNGAVPTFDRFNTPNSALSFDGNNNFVLVPSSSSLNVQNSITLSAWIKTNNPHIIQDVNPGSIIAKHETVQTRQYDLFFYSTNYDSLHFDLVDQRDNFSSDEYFFATSTPSASYRNNQWHMVVGTYDYNTGFSQIYIDGALTSSRYLGQINLMKSNVPLTIGCYSEQNSNFRGFYQGIIDDIRIYDRSLSQQEIMMLYYEKEYVPISLTLITPIGGEVFQANSLVPIEWSASNVNNFSLEFTSDNGASWSLICDTLTAASTGFLWYAPDIESNMVRVRISDKNNPALFDESDSNFTITNKITQYIPLFYSGWNMISFYVQPLPNLPRDVFPSPLVLQVKTELQSFDPALPEFLNTLKSVYASQGYLVKTDSVEHSFPVIGDHFYPADGINYRAGWNLMSYYYSYGESVWYAFEPIMTSVEEIKTLTSYYNPLGSPETNTLYTLEPGEAYWLRLKNNIDGYVLPSPQAIMPKKHQTTGQKLMADLPWKLKGYPQSTVAIFTVTSDGKPVPAGSVVAVFVNGECRAISEVKLNSEGNAFATLVINGDKEEEVSFKIFDAKKKEAFGSNLKMKTKPGTTIAGIQELPFTFVTGVEDPILPTTTTLMNAYPNPFNPETRIRYSLNKDQHVSLKIYDVLGKEVITLVDDTKNAGYYEVSFDASGLPSGIYFYRMQSGDYVSVKKLLLLK